LRSRRNLPVLASRVRCPPPSLQATNGDTESLRKSGALRSPDLSILRATVADLVIVVAISVSCGLIKLMPKTYTATTMMVNRRQRSAGDQPGRRQHHVQLHVDGIAAHADRNTAAVIDKLNLTRTKAILRLCRRRSTLRTGCGKSHQESGHTLGASQPAHPSECVRTQPLARRADRQYLRPLPDAAAGRVSGPASERASAMPRNWPNSRTRCASRRIRSPHFASARASPTHGEERERGAGLLACSRASCRMPRTRALGEVKAMSAQNANTATGRWRADLSAAQHATDTVRAVAHHVRRAASKSWNSKNQIQHAAQSGRGASWSEVGNSRTSRSSRARGQIAQPWRNSGKVLAS